MSWVPTDQCSCAPPVVGPMGLVHVVESCPVCIGRALRWFGEQGELFPEGRESVSVSAVLASEGLNSAIRMSEVVEDDLPF